MTDEQIIFRWHRSTKDFNACKVLSHLSQRSITDIIYLICTSGHMTKWTNNRNYKRVKGNNHGEKNTKTGLSDT